MRNHRNKQMNLSEIQTYICEINPHAHTHTYCTYAEGEPSINHQWGTYSTVIYTQYNTQGRNCRYQASTNAAAGDAVMHLH